MLNLSPYSMQQTLHVNPTKEERKPTNSPCLTIFSLILFIWLCIIIKIFNDRPKSLEDLELSRQLQFGAAEQITPRFTWKFPVCTIVSGLIAIIYTFVLSQSRGRFVVYIGMILLCCLIFLTTMGVIAVSTIYTYEGISSYLLITFLFVLLVFIIAYLVTSIRCALSVGIETIFEIIRDSCRALRCCPSIAIFSCVISVIVILIITFIVFVIKRIISSNYSDSAVRFYIFLNLYCATVLTNFITNFTQIVISGCVIDWFWSKDPSTLTIKRSFRKTLSFHMGSVAFYSIPLLPHVCSMYQVSRCRDSDNDVEKRYNFLTRFFSHVRVFISVVDFGMVQTSIYGYECKTAIMAAHDLVSQNNHKINLAVCEISNMAIAFGSFFMTIPFQVEDIYSSIYALVIPFYIVMATAVRTLLVNKMIITYTSEALKEDRNSVQSVMVL